MYPSHSYYHVLMAPLQSYVQFSAPHCAMCIVEIPIVHCGDVQFGSIYCDVRTPLCAVSEYVLLSIQQAVSKSTAPTAYEAPHATVTAVSIQVQRYCF